MSLSPLRFFLVDTIIDRGQVGGSNDHMGMAPGPTPVIHQTIAAKNTSTTDVTINADTGLSRTAAEISRMIHHAMTATAAGAISVDLSLSRIVVSPAVAPIRTSGSSREFFCI
ncbi:hypothetical protein GQ649_32820 [Rhodococcus sp. DSM 6344]|nr:hypothetical protein [Rhodococcus erythropolis]